MAQVKAPAGLKPAYTMERILDRDEEGNVKTGKDGNPVCIGVNLRRAKTKWNLSPELVMKSSQEGWMKLDGNTLAVMHSRGVLRYKVVTMPGYYCCHCNAPLPEGGATAQLHVAACGDGKDSPDQNNPAGYKRNNFYGCELES